MSVDGKIANGERSEAVEPVNGRRARIDEMRQHEKDSEENGHAEPETLTAEPASDGGVGRAGEEEEKDCGAHNDKAEAVGKQVDEGGVEDGWGHDYEGSIGLTLLMLVALVLCGLKGGDLWWQSGFFAGMYAFGIGILWFAGWKLGESDDGDDRFEIEFRDARIVLSVFGFGAVFFGSPEQCVLAGGVLAFGVVVAAPADYWALAAVSRQRGCSLAKALWLLLPRPPGRSARP